jgi:hypothetical protein
LDTEGHFCIAERQPLAVNGANGHAPEVAGESGQLRDVVGHLPVVHHFALSTKTILSSLKTDSVKKSSDNFKFNFKFHQKI